VNPERQAQVGMKLYFNSSPSAINLPERRCSKEAVMKNCLGRALLSGGVLATMAWAQEFPTTPKQETLSAPLTGVTAGRSRILSAWGSEFLEHPGRDRIAQIVMVAHGS
jgi:hypothetical protein